MSFDPSILTAPLRAKFCCSGIHEIQRNGFTFFFLERTTPGEPTFTFRALAFPTPHISSRRMDLLTATDTQLRNLFQASDAVEGSDASFRTLQPDYFSSNLDLERSGLLRTLQPFLLDGYLEKQGIEAELCELNVYSTPFDPFRIRSSIRAFARRQRLALRRCPRSTYLRTYVRFTHRFLSDSLRRGQYASAASRTRLCR
jgi:hypothetical protein